MIRVARGLAFVVGPPRPGRMHEGVPPGGAMVPELLAAANAAAGRPWDTPAVEHWGPITLSGTGTVGTDAGPIEIDGERVLRPTSRVGYVALATGGPPASAPPFDPGGPIRVVPGPDPGFLAGSFRVGPVGNRVGVRLEGPPLTTQAIAASTPVVRGAIQVPPSGELIVLGPEHPTTGGYPVVAVVCGADLGRLFARPPGATVELVPISVVEARRASKGDPCVRSS